MTEVAAEDLVGALCICADSLFNATTTPESASRALDAATVLVGSARAAVIDRDPRAIDQVVMAKSMASKAGEGGNLGLAHCLARALESELQLSHNLAVGVLMPRVIRFNAPVARDMMGRLAVALAAGAIQDDPERVAMGVEAALFDLYHEIGFPNYFDPVDFDPDLIQEMAMAAGRGLHGEGYLETPPTRQTLIPSPNKRRATIHEAGEIFEGCFF